MKENGGSRVHLKKICECYSSNKEVGLSRLITSLEEKEHCFQGAIQARHPQARVTECQEVCLRQMEAEKIKDTDGEKIF